MTAADFDLWHHTEPLNTMISRPEERIAAAVDAWEGNDRIRAAVLAQGVADDLKAVAPRLPKAVALAVARFMVESTVEARREARAGVRKQSAALAPRAAEPVAGEWPAVGATVLVRDVPQTDTQRELWAGRPAPARKGEVVESPADGSQYLTLDVGGDYGGVTYPARDFPTRYAWKLARAAGEVTT